MHLIDLCMGLLRVIASEAQCHQRRKIFSAANAEARNAGLGQDDHCLIFGLLSVTGAPPAAVVNDGAGASAAEAFGAAALAGAAAGPAKGATAGTAAFGAAAEGLFAGADALAVAWMSLRDWTGRSGLREAGSAQAQTAAITTRARTTMDRTRIA